jgi:hypothetical protein
MTDVLDYKKTNSPSSEALGWNLEGRFRYRSKHRAEDLALIQKDWPISGSKAVVHIDDVPTSIQKKWKRSFKSHLKYCFEGVNDISRNFHAFLDLRDASNNPHAAEREAFAENMKTQVAVPCTKCYQA